MAGTSRPVNTEPPPPPAEDLWYMVYRDAANKLHTVKGATESIRKNLAAGALGDLATILVSRTKAGQFQPLRNAPEFRDLVLQYLSSAAATPAVPVRAHTPGSKLSVDGPPLVPGAGRSASANTPDGAKMATPRSGVTVPNYPGPGAARAYETTEVHAVAPLAKASSSTDVNSPFRSARPAAPPARRGATEWLPYATLGFILALLILVTLFLATR